jgi:hypothetical protein
MIVTVEKVDAGGSFERFVFGNDGLSEIADP